MTTIYIVRHVFANSYEGYSEIEGTFSSQEKADAFIAKQGCPCAYVCDEYEIDAK